MMSVHSLVHIFLTSALAILVHQYWQIRQQCFQLSQNVTYIQRDLVSNNSLKLTEPLSFNVTTESLGDTSVWCWGNNHTDRLCHFHNLCYLVSADEFLFLHGPASLYVGLPSDRYSPALLDFSSVADHNTQYFNYIDAIGSRVRQSFTGKRLKVLREAVLIFRRFHSDNLMHVFHDDLLPMFDTIRTVPNVHIGRVTDATLRSELRPVFMDESSHGPYDDLYKLFSIFEPLYKEDLRSTGSDLVCFAEAYVGLLKSSTWYQYGFTRPQGPIEGHTATAKSIREFCQHVRRQLNVGTDNRKSADGPILVLLSRKYNRLILNEADLILALAGRLRVKVFSVGLETHDLAEIISVVSSANVVVGMHGSMLSLAMFLPPSAILVELFPYGVNPTHYTPYRTLAELPGMNISYVAWRNDDTAKTVTYPDRPQSEGGITHLPIEVQESILASDEVPRHLCCNDPEWLFRIYQDTTVDVDAIVSLIAAAQQSLSELPVAPASVGPAFDVELELLPSHARNVTCIGGRSDYNLPSLHVSWLPPANVQFLGDREILRYEVWIQENGADDYSAWMLTKFEHSFTAGIQPATDYVIWVRCILNESVGPFNSIPATCSTE